MRIFITGATGFIGSAVTKELIGSGHEVLGMTRSEAGAAQLTALGATPHHGSLEDLDSIRRGAAAADAVIHLAFNHDFSRYVQNCEDDRRVIEAIGEVLAGSDRRLIVTSGSAMARGQAGRPAREDDPPSSSAVSPRAASEEAVNAAAERGVHACVVRLPQVHDPVKQGLVTYVVQLAREKGLSPYIGSGDCRWPAAHVSDVARLYRLALEKGEAGARYHAVAEEGVPMREIAGVIGQGLGVPVQSIPQEEAPAHFGWLSMFTTHDMPASSAWTREQLGWQPTGPGLIADLRAMDYARSV